jgi:hypothetical protein
MKTVHRGEKNWVLIKLVLSGQFLFSLKDLELRAPTLIQIQSKETLTMRFGMDGGWIMNAFPLGSSFSIFVIAEVAIIQIYGKPKISSKSHNSSKLS